MYLFFNSFHHNNLLIFMQLILFNFNELENLYLNYLIQIN